MSEVTIRYETPADIPVIRIVTEAAFRDMAISQLDEQDIIDALREMGALTLSLVAVWDGQFVEHIRTIWCRQIHVSGRP